jgi:hypothetical protein
VPGDISQPIILPKSLVNKAVTETVFQRAGANQVVARDNRTTVNESITASRARNNLIASIRDLYSREGTFSSAAFSFVEVAIAGYSAKAYNTQTGQFDLAGSLMARQIIASFDTLFDYSQGYGDKTSFESLLEQSLLEVVLTSALAQELVLDKARFPSKINTIPFETLDWKNVGSGAKAKKIPQQNRSEGDPIPLDYPTIFICELHRQANRAYSDSMLAAGVNNTYTYGEFLQEMRRAVRHQGHGRLVLKISIEQVMAALPEDIKADKDKLQTALDAVKTNIETALKDINPEDALVMYDTVTPDMLKGNGEKSDYVPLIETLSGLLATSLKSNPSMLGLRMQGSQSLSNTESLVFLKIANAARRPVETNLSRILTLAARLYGADVYVKFKFDPINLRPDLELEAFKTMRQARTLELLSEGFLTDDEAAWDLGTGPRAPGAPPLAGSGFRRGSKGIDANSASPNDDPQGRALQSNEPKKAGGASQ